MPNRIPANPLNDIYKVLGSLEADVRTIKHSQNGASMKLDVIGSMVVQIDELNKAKDDHGQRIGTLEDQRSVLTGAKLLLIFIVQTIIACIAAFAGGGWFSGKH